MPILSTAEGWGEIAFPAKKKQFQHDNPPADDRSSTGSTWGSSSSRSNQ